MSNLFRIIQIITASLIIFFSIGMFAPKFTYLLEVPNAFKNDWQAIAPIFVSETSGQQPVINTVANYSDIPLNEKRNSVNFYLSEDTNQNQLVVILPHATITIAKRQDDDGRTFIVEVVPVGLFWKSWMWLTKTQLQNEQQEKLNTFRL